MENQRTSAATVVVPPPRKPYSVFRQVRSSDEVVAQQQQQQQPLEAFEDDFALVLVSRDNMIALNRMATRYCNNLERSRRRGRKSRAAQGTEEKRGELPPLKPAEPPVQMVLCNHLSRKQAESVARAVLKLQSDRNLPLDEIAA